MGVPGEVPPAVRRRDADDHARMAAGWGPAIRRQVLRDLVGEPEEAVAIGRARVSTDGFGGELLAMRLPNGGWRDVPNPRRSVDTPDGSAMYALQLLTAMGVDPEDDPVRRAVDLVGENVTHHEGGRAFFEGTERNIAVAEEERPASA